MPFLLILVGIILVILNYKALKKDDTSFDSMLKYKKEDISDIEVEIGEIRRDIAESLTELQQEILSLKDEIHGSSNKKIEFDLPLDVKEEVEVDEKVIDEKSFLLNGGDGVINDIRKESKTERIKALIDLGLNDEEICEKLSLGKGEVLLVRGLYKK